MYEGARELSLTESAAGAGISLDRAGKPVTKDELAAGMAQIMACFPQQNPEVLKYAGGLILAEGKSSAWFAGAVKRVIMEHKYPTMTVSDILSFGLKIDCWTYAQMCDCAYRNGARVWSERIGVRVGGKLVYVTEGDYERYKEILADNA